MRVKRLDKVLGARIGRWPLLCNGPHLLLLIGLLAIAVGCKEDEPAVTGVKDGGLKSKGLDLGTIEVALAPLDLLRRLPKAPPGIRALPGQSADPIKSKKSGARPSRYSPGWMVEIPESGPYKMVHYQLSPDGKSVEAIVATLTRGYAVKERYEALEEAIKMRLGKGTVVDKDSTFLFTAVGSNYTGKKWTLVDFRFELRKDKETGDAELVFHKRGRVDPTTRRR